MIRFVWLALSVALCVLPACKSEPAVPGRIALAVFAASSLTEAFQDLERRFEAAHPSIDVRLTFAGSQVLRLQLEQGAAADVFASANQAHMQALVDAGLVSRSEVFAHNQLVVIVPRSNPSSIETFRDLPRAKRLVIGTENVPVGIYAREVFKRAAQAFGAGFAEAVRRSVVSEESNVRLVRAKVELAEADAAVVYRTDAVSSDRLRVVTIPAALNLRAQYPMGVVARSGHRIAVRQFVDFVRSDAGQATLVEHGFTRVAP